MTNMDSMIILDYTEPPAISKAQEGSTVKKDDKYTGAFGDPENLSPDEVKTGTAAQTNYNNLTTDLNKGLADKGAEVRGQAKDVSDKELWQWADWNPSKDTSQGNLNEQSFDTTMRYSRMADMLNNKLHLTPSSIGARTATRGSSGTGLDQIGIGMQKGPQVETQETRQMRANEQADMFRRQQDIKRQGTIQDRILRVQQQLDDGMVALANKIYMSKEELAILIAQLQEQKEYGDTYDKLLDQLYQRFAANLTYHNQARVADFLNEHRNEFIKATMFGQQVGVVMPSAFESAVNSIYEKELNNKTFDDMSSEELKNFIRHILSVYCTMAGQIMNQVAPDFMSSAIGLKGTYGRWN